MNVELMLSPAIEIGNQADLSEAANIDLQRSGAVTEMNIELKLSPEISEWDKEIKSDIEAEKADVSTEKTEKQSKQLKRACIKKH